MDINKLTYSDWDSLDSRLIWAYTDQVLPQYQNAWMDGAGTVSARCFLNGKVGYWFEGKQYRVEPGEWFFAPSGRYRQALSPNAKHHSIRFRAHWITGVSLFDHSQPLVVKKKQAQRLHEAGVELCQSIGKHYPEYRNQLQSIPANGDLYFEISDLFGRWLRVYFETMSALSVPQQLITNIDARVRRGIEYIRDNLHQESLTSETIAAAAGSSASHFAKLFREETGQSVGQFVAAQRRQQVLEFVQVEGKSIKEAAYSVGFRSLAHFSRWFKTQTGKAPREYFGLLD